MPINFPNSPSLNQEYSSGSKTWYWTGTSWKAKLGSVISLPEITPLDDLSGQFDGLASRFLPSYQGISQTISNPLRLLLMINGIIQRVSFPEYVWGSFFSRDGFMIDSDGYIAFSESVPAGSTFDARIMVGPETTSLTTIYPFKAIDILIGA
jgi:hypothetical protein